MLETCRARCLNVTFGFTRRFVSLPIRFAKKTSRENYFQVRNGKDTPGPLVHQLRTWLLHTATIVQAQSTSVYVMLWAIYRRQDRKSRLVSCPTILPIGKRGIVMRQHLQNPCRQRVSLPRNEDREKDPTKDEVDEIIHCLTDYSQNEPEKQLDVKTFLDTYFAHAPKLNPARPKITGAICGARVEEIEEPLMQEIRYMDKLIDELARSISNSTLGRGTAARSDDRGLKRELMLRTKRKRT